jgi:uncharacterized protein HemY
MPTVDAYLVMGRLDLAAGHLDQASYHLDLALKMDAGNRQALVLQQQVQAARDKQR